jgi:hypothetical protein
LCDITSRRRALAEDVASLMTVIGIYNVQARSTRVSSNHDAAMSAHESIAIRIDASSSDRDCT